MLYYLATVSYTNDSIVSCIYIYIQNTCYMCEYKNTHHELYVNVKRYIIDSIQISCIHVHIQDICLLRVQEYVQGAVFDTFNYYMAQMPAHLSCT